MIENRNADVEKKNRGRVGKKAQGRKLSRIVNRRGKVGKKI